MEEIYYEEQSKKHIFLKCVLFIFILGAIVGVFIYFKYQQSL